MKTINIKDFDKYTIKHILASNVGNNYHKQLIIEIEDFNQEDIPKFENVITYIVIGRLLNSLTTEHNHYTSHYSLNEAIKFYNKL